MFPRLVYESFRHQSRRKLLAGIAITLGVAVATAMIAVATDIGDKINRELRSYGANLVVTPQEDTLDVEVGGDQPEATERRHISERSGPPENSWHVLASQYRRFLPHAAGHRETGQREWRDRRHAGRHVLQQGTPFRERRLRHRRANYSSLVEGEREGRCADGRSTRPDRVEASPADCGWPDDSSQNVLVGERLAARLAKKQATPSKSPVAS